jgi:hypothetical protein
VLKLNEIKSFPEAPVSHPFIERLIGSISREFLDQIFFWNATDLERKLVTHQLYFNESRGYHGIGGITLLQESNDKPGKVISLAEYRWKKHCNGLYQFPTAT